MGTNKPWKIFERACAVVFGGKRIVPSDDRSRGDVLHDYLYIECKCYLKKQPAIVTLYNDTAKKAKVEGKLPVVCLKRAGTTTGFLVVVAASDLEAAYVAYRLAENEVKYEG